VVRVGLRAAVIQCLLGVCKTRMKLIFLTVLVVLSASCLEAKSIPTTNVIIQNRGMADLISNQLGLGAIWSQINALGGNFASEIVMEGVQLILAGATDKLAAAKAVFAKLVDDLTNHGIVSLQTATQMIQNSIKEVANLLKGSEKRDIADFLLNTIGLQGVWDDIQLLGNNFAAQLIAEGMQLVFAGKDKLAQAQLIFAQLVADLTSHTGNAAVIVQNAINMVAELLKKPSEKRDVADFILNTLGLQGVWDDIQALGGNFVAQLLNEGMQLVFAGQDKLAQAQLIFAQLVADLTSHTGNAAVIVQNAINMVAELLKKPTEKRDISDFLINSLGLGAVWDQINALGGGLVSQIMSEGMQLVFAGREKLEAAKQIFANLVDELTNHGIQTAQTATNFIKEAIKEVSAILSNSQKRDIANFIINSLGLGAVWDQIQNLGGEPVAQIIQEGLALLMSGKEVVAQAKEIFAQLVKDLTAHTSTASVLVAQAIAQVAQLLNLPAQM
jgi:exonuclease VII small subunit